MGVVRCHVPRHYFDKRAVKQLQLHVFADASEDAFAAVGYWRYITVCEMVGVAFVCAKTKTAPLKPLTIPRLELQAPVLGIRLMKTISNEHSFKINDFFLWSDSSTVLNWINSENRRYKPFVAHRIAEILDESKPSNWRWVWPKFLRGSQEYWPDADAAAEEIEKAQLTLCRLVQEEAYVVELKNIAEKRPIAHDSELYQLCPYADEDGVLRVYGRIDAATWLPHYAKRPMILPGRHLVTRLIVAYKHSKMFHQNTEATITEICRTFWVPRLRHVLRSVIANCNVCKISKANPFAPLMGSLPQDRLTPYVRLLTFTGLDYFGTINVSIGRRTEKRWVSLFTCLTVRAIHLELAQDLSTDSCILCIRNFINRNVVNSRPLTHIPVSSDQEEPLTPNHFLLGSANTANTPSVEDPVKKLCSLRKQWRLSRQYRDRFWKRWIAEYLPTLTRRVKWCRRERPLHVGDLVLVCETSTPRRSWCRGRVVQVYQATDGEVRRADVRTSSGVLRRPASKLAILDVDNGGTERSTWWGI